QPRPRAEVVDLPVHGGRHRRPAVPRRPHPRLQPQERMHRVRRLLERHQSPLADRLDHRSAMLLRQRLQPAQVLAHPAQRRRAPPPPGPPRRRPPPPAPPPPRPPPPPPAPSVRPRAPPATPPSRPAASPSPPNNSRNSASDTARAAVSASVRSAVRSTRATSS